jgi:hypothetical protein
MEERRKRASVGVSVRVSDSAEAGRESAAAELTPAMPKGDSFGVCAPLLVPGMVWRKPDLELLRSGTFGVRLGLRAATPEAEEAAEAAPAREAANRGLEWERVRREETKDGSKSMLMLRGEVRGDIRGLGS